MKALIIGAAGFVGEYLAEEIKREITSDVAVTKLPSESLAIKGAEVYDLDILDAQAVYELLRTLKPAYIFHLAAQSSVAFAWKNPGLTTEINVEGSLNVINAIRDELPSGTRTLIVGSGEEYGYIREEQLPLKESTLLTPGNIYAVTKVCQSMMSTVYSRAYDMQMIMVRAFNHIGPKQRDTFVVSSFCKQAAEIEKGLHEPILRVGNLAAKRDFTDVRDVVHAYARLIQFGHAGETYNVGRGHAVSIASVLDMILAKAHAKIDVQIDPERFRPADVPIIEPSVDKIFSHAGWKPRITLEESIEDILDYWRAQL